LRFSKNPAGGRLQGEMTATVTSRSSAVRNVLHHDAIEWNRIMVHLFV